MQRDQEVTFREATAADLPRIVRLLADDPLGATRETPGDQIPEAYFSAFTAIDKNPNNHLITAEVDGEIAGTLQLTYIPGLTYTGGERAQIEGVRVTSPRPRPPDTKGDHKISIVVHLCVQCSSFGCAKEPSVFGGPQRGREAS